MQRIAEDVARGRLKPRSIDEQTIARYLPEPDMPDVDLFVRSSGEQRTSNFLLWQSAYAEMVFQDTALARLRPARPVGRRPDLRRARPPLRRGRRRPDRMSERLVELFPEVAGAAADLIRHRSVAERWADESACAGMTVGGLANHLAGQAANVVRLFATPPRDPEPITALEPADLEERVVADLAALPAALAPLLDGSRVPDTVLVPWQGWSLSSADFVLTRTMEVLVHSDDLAASIGVATPRFPEEAGAAVLALLASVAAERHGQAAVLRALSRPQRSTGPVSAF